MYERWWVLRCFVGKGFVMLYIYIEFCWGGVLEVVSCNYYRYNLNIFLSFKYSRMVDVY